MPLNLFAYMNKIDLSFPPILLTQSSDNRVKLNSDKCKELRISFAKEESHFAPIVISNEELGLVNSAKLLGVTISNYLTWNEHINEIIKKASKRSCFLSQLKRARVAKQDLVFSFLYLLHPFHSNLRISSVFQCSTIVSQE